jgi:hypothetical protein
VSWLLNLSRLDIFNGNEGHASSGQWAKPSVNSAEEEKS